MNWIWREKPDGTRGLGYPAYVLITAAAFGGILWLRRQVETAPAPALFRPHRRGADVRTITSAAAAVTPVHIAGSAGTGASKSYRIRPAAAPAAPAVDAPSGFDAIGETLKQPKGAAHAGGARHDAAYAALPPALPEAEGDDDHPTRAARSMLLAYRDAAADTPEPGAPATAGSSAPWLARGTLVPVYLLTTVDTSNPAALLQFGVAEDVAAHGKVRLRFGTRLFGRIAGKPLRDRLILVAESVLYPDGKELPIAATAVEADEGGFNVHPGLGAAYIPPPAWAQAAPYVSQFATGFLGLLQSRAQQGLTIGVGGLNLVSTVPNDAKGPAYQASAEAIGDFTRARLHEYEDRYAAYYIIPAGTSCWLQLQADFAGDPSHES